MRTLCLLFAAGVVVVGCGKKQVVPQGEKKITLAGKTATLHDWAKVDPCLVDPKVVKGDLDSFYAVANDYVGQTGAGPDGVWAPEQIALLEEGVVVLPPAIDAVDKLAAALQKGGCRFTKELGFAEPLKKADELGQQARKRVSEAPAIAEGLAAKAALKAWKDKQPEARTGAKGEWCPPKLKPGAPVDIYYASEDEVGLTEWLFCDDCRVFASVGAAPAFEAPATMKKKPKDKAYLEAAAKYPASDIQRAPKGPASASDGGTDGADGGTTDADAGVPDAGT